MCWSAAVRPRRLPQAAVREHERACGMSKGTGLNLELSSQRSWQRAAFVGPAQAFRYCTCSRGIPSPDLSLAVGQGPSPPHKPSSYGERGPDL